MLLGGSRSGLPSVGMSWDQGGSEAGRVRLGHPARGAGAEGCQSPGRSHHGQTQGWARALSACQPPGESSQAFVSSELCPGRLNLGWSWHWAGTGNSQKSEWVSGKRLQSLLEHLGHGNVSSSHVFFQLFFTVTGDGIRFFFPLYFFILNSSTSGFCWGEKKILVGHEYKSGSTWQFSCYFQLIWLLQSVASLCQSVLVILFSQDKQSPWFSTIDCILSWELNQGAGAL